METIPHITVEPPRKANGCVIWLHGLGADGHDFEGILPSLGLPADHAIRFLFPHAPLRPITVNNGMVMPGWYDIASGDFSRRGDETGIESSVTLINHLIVQQMDSGVAANRIVLAGFSQGGVIALHTALRFSQPLAGVMALSSYLPFPEKIPEASAAAAPIFIAHGSHDTVVPFDEGRRACDTLQQQGYPCDWHHYPMEHAVCAEEVDAISHYIRQQLP